MNNANESECKQGFTIVKLDFNVTMSINIYL